MSRECVENQSPAVQKKGRWEVRGQGLGLQHIMVRNWAHNERGVRRDLGNEGDESEEVVSQLFGVGVRTGGYLSPHCVV